MGERHYDRLIGVESARCIALYPASYFHHPNACPSKLNRLLARTIRR